MPEVLTIRRPEKSGGFDVVGVITLLAGSFYLGHLWYRNQPLHFANDVLNVAAHVLLVVAPLVASLIAFREPLRKESKVERLILRQGFWQQFPHGWWIVLPMLAAAAVAVTVALHRASLIFSPGAGDGWSTHPGIALLVWLGTFGLGLFYGTLFNEGEEVRISDEGLRWGITQFAEWQNIDHVTERGDTLLVFHKVHPGIPFASVGDYGRLRGDVEPYLRRHTVRRDDATPVALRLAQVTAVLVSVLIVGGCLWLYFGGTLRGVWTVALAFGGSLAIGLLLEWHRGVMRATRGKSQTEPLMPTAAAQPVAEPEPVDFDADAEIRGAVEQAIRHARDSYGVELVSPAPGATPDALALGADGVESILGKLHGYHRSTAFDDDRLRTEVWYWGAYLGEAARTLRPGEWYLDDMLARQDATEAKLIFADGSQAYPMAWCHKRITDGPGHDVSATFRTVVASGEGLARAPN